MKKAYLYISFLTLLSMPMAACGIKPSSLQPPAGAENTPFPRTYPAPDSQ